jgi:hypothetical protein
MTPEFVDPAYGDRSLVDLLPALAHAMHVEAGLPSSRLVLPEASRYVVLLIDALGFELLAAHPDEAPFLHGLMDGSSPGTAAVPSTTATSLTSFGTARAPGSHGVVGYTTRIPGTDELLNALKWSKSVDPCEWQPHRTALSRLAKHGVATTVVNKREFAGSGLTLAGQRGATFVGADRVGERIAAAIAASSTSPSLTYLYDGDLDWTGHRYGVDSVQWRQQLAMADSATEHLRAALSDDVRLLVVADHGMVDSPANDRLEVDDHPELLDGVVVFGGEARFRHLYCSGGAVPDVLDAWTAAVDGRAEVIARGDALARGWFGTVDPAVRPRLGDVMVASRGSFSVTSASRFSLEAELVGMHGSLTSAEMLIPLLVA